MSALISQETSVQTTAPAETAASTETPQTATTGETAPSAHVAPSKSKKKRRSKKTTRVADSSSESSDEEASQVERKPGRQSSLTQQQQDLVRSKFPAWEHILRKHELHLGKKDAHARDPDGVTAWIKETIADIKTSPAFETFNDTSQKLNKILKGMFRNYRNNTFIKKNKHFFVTEAMVNKRQIPDSTSADVAKADALKAADALACFKNSAPAKEIFREENDEKIKEEAERLRAEAAEQRAAEGRNPEDIDSRKDDNFGGFYQRALSALWKEADRELYQEKANTYDLYSNQEEFPKVIKTALEALCQNGAMGPTEIFFMSGFRNEHNEVVICRMSCHYKDGEMQPGFLRHKGEQTESATLTRKWHDYCNIYLPKKDVDETSIRNAESTYITTNRDAIPVLVNFSLRNLKPAHLCEILKTFLRTLWCMFRVHTFSSQVLSLKKTTVHTWPQDQEQPSIPLLEILKHPDDYYNTEKYKFPVTFAEIETLPIGDLYTLADFLLSKSGVSCPDPFVFWEKEDIISRRASRRRLQALELSTGEEILPCTQIYAHLPPTGPDHSFSSTTLDPLLSTVEELPSANNQYQSKVVASPDAQDPGEEPSSSAIPTPSTVLDTRQPSDLPSVSIDSTVAPDYGRSLSPSSGVHPVSPPPDEAMDVDSPNSNPLTPDLPSLGVVASQDAAILKSLNTSAPVSISSVNAPVTVSATANSSPEVPPTRRSRRGVRSKIATSGGATVIPAHSANDTVQTEVRRSSRAKSGKRANTVPDSRQRPAKKPKLHHKGYANLIPQPNGKLGLVYSDGSLRGYVIKDSDGKEIVVDENGQFIEVL
ncbi:hypothetical protein EV360DRAFT_88539 [Lentinula raphanica]|nr:hypothetical protein EV360DRAFT_88539 [Lentinula raphanica]